MSAENEDHFDDIPIFLRNLLAGRYQLKYALNLEYKSIKQTPSCASSYPDGQTAVFPETKPFKALQLPSIFCQKAQ